MVQVCDPGTLVDMVRRGDPAALDRVTRCYGERLLEVGRRRCRSDEDAKDAVQDALLSAGTHLGDFRGEGSLEGWLVRMVANACFRLRRGRKNDPALHDRDAVLKSLDADPEIAAGRAELATALGEALLTLSPQDRAIVLLAEAEGWTGPEIAAETGLSPAAVRTRLTRARGKLRDALAAWAATVPQGDASPA